MKLNFLKKLLSYGLILGASSQLMFASFGIAFVCVSWLFFE